MIRINGYPIDVALKESIHYESEVTKSPLEKGADVADHVIARLPVITFDGVVSDTPIGAVANDETRLTLNGATPSQDAYQRFVAIHEAKGTVTVECSFGKFDQMVMTALDAGKEARTAKSFSFTAVFEDIRIFENRRTTVRVAVPNCGKKENFGLSLDKVTNGKQILWRKGKPPGTSPSTDPKGVIIGQEIVHAIGGSFFHEDKKKKLTTQELTDFTADLNRDSALQQRRGIARAEEQVQKNGERIDRAMKFLEEKERRPGQYVDPAAFGFKPNGEDL